LGTKKGIENKNVSKRRWEIDWPNFSFFVEWNLFQRERQMEGKGGVYGNASKCIKI
jgi:hypothetical protein